MSLLEIKPSAPEAPPQPDEPEAAPAGATTPCSSCGAPLEPDQLACLECGQIVRRRRLIPSGWPLRAGLASFVALLVSACAGLGVSAAFQGGGKVPKTVAVAPPAIPGPPAIPPPPKAPTPAAPAPAAAPKAAAPAPAKPATPGAPGGVSHTPGVSGTPSNGGVGPSPTVQAQPGGGSPPPFPNGIPFDSANLLDSSDTADNPDSVNNAIDGDAGTSWKTAPGPHQVGIWFDAGSSGAYPDLGIDAGSSYTVTIYGSDANSPPSGNTPAGWNKLSNDQVAVVGGKKNSIRLNDSIRSRYYLIWITVGSTRANIIDTALLSG